MTKDHKNWEDQFVHHWKYYIVPARASPSDLEFIRKKTEERRKICEDSGEECNVLILGSTPEYRKLFDGMGVKVVCLDFSKYNYDYLTEDEMDGKYPEKESFVEGNWVTTVLPDKFDIILADNVFNVCEKAKIDDILGNIAEMLKDGGFFMPRTYVRDEDERKDPLEVLKEYREKHADEPIYSWTLRDFYMAAYDFESDIEELDHIWDIASDLHAKGLMKDEELKVFEDLGLQDRHFKFFIPVRERWDKMLEQFFEIKRIFHGSEAYLRKQFPLHVCVRK